LPTMNRSPQVRWIDDLRILGLLTILGTTIGCAGGQEITAEAINQAKQVWKTADIRDYDLDWTVTGAQNNHYYVTVRGGDVRKVESAQADGRRFELHPSETRFYSVDGLFLTIADELAQLKTDHPFGQPQGTKVVMRFKPDKKLGYPLWYRRDVMGTSQAIAIDVIKLVPLTSPAK
jgi:Family of unknown function (DUF6174)